MNMKLRKAISIFCAASLFLTSVPFRAYTEGDPAPATPPEEQEEFMPESAPGSPETEELEIEDVTIPQNVWAHYVIEIPQTPDRSTWTLTENEEARKEQVIRITSGRDISLFFLLNTDAEAAALLSMEDNESRKKFTATDANEIPALSEETGSHYILKNVQIEAGGSRLIRIKSATPVKFTLKAMTGSAWQKLTAAPNKEETEKTEEPAQEENNGQPANEENAGAPLEVEELTETPAAEKQEEPAQKPAEEENNKEPANEENAGTTLEGEELTETPAAEKQKEPAQESAKEEKNEESAETANEGNNEEPAETVNKENVEETAENEAPADEKQDGTAEEKQEEAAQESAEEGNNEKPAENVNEENTEEPAKTVNEENAENEEPAEEKQDGTAEEKQEEAAQESAEKENNEKPAETANEENTEEPAKNVNEEKAENEEPAEEKQDGTAEEKQEEAAQESAEEGNNEKPAENVNEENTEEPAENVNEENAENEEPAEEKQDGTAEEKQEEAAQESAEEENNEKPAETVGEENAEEPAENVNEEKAENEESAEEKQDGTAEEKQEEEPAQESAEEENNEKPTETVDEENAEETAENVNEENAEETAEDQEENPEEESAEEAEAEPEEEFWEEVISEHIDDYTVTVTITKEAEFPIGTTVKITPLNSTAYLNEAAGIFDKNENELGNFIRVFDITFYYEDMEIEPLVPIDVKITFDNAVQLEGENELKLIHLHEEEEAREIDAEAQTTEVEAETAENAGDENAQTQTVTNVESLSFQSGKFSTYIVAEEVVVYTFSQSGQNYEVVLKYNAGANMPEDAVFSVEEITEDSELYEQYRAQVAAVINPEGTVRMPALLDISLKKENGEKFPLGNKVQVIVRLTGDENLTKELKVVHFPGEDPFQGESAVRDAVAESDAHAEIEVLDIESEKLFGRVNTAENTVTFNTNSFSVFALAYTVDFYYGEFEYHMEGSGEMLLSELFAQLGIERSAADVVRAEFTDPSLLQLERTEDDWKLTSLQPFDTVESLTLNFRNGDTILLRVEDSRDAFRIVVNDTTAGYITWDSSDELVNDKDCLFAAVAGEEPVINHNFTANQITSRFAFWLAVYPDKSTEIIYGKTLPATTQTREGGITTFIACFAPNNAKLVVMYAKSKYASDISSKAGVHGVGLPGNSFGFQCFYTSENNYFEANPNSKFDNASFLGWYNGNMLIWPGNVFNADAINSLTELEDIFITPVYGDLADNPTVIVNGMFVSRIKFFDINSTINGKTSSSPMHITGTSAAPTLTKNYYLLAVLKDNAGHELGWAVNPVALNGKAETTTGFYAFHQFEETPGSGGRGSDTNTPTLLYTAGNQVETRLYYSDDALSASNQTYAYLKSNAIDHPETGYEFGGNFINSEGENEIHLKAAPPEKKYYVRVYFDEEAETAFNAGDGYYVNVKVSHASSVDSFQGELLEINPTSLQTDSNGNRYIDFDFTNWKDGSGQNTLGSFTGYESSILVELIHQWQNTYQPNYDTNNAAPIPEGTLAKSYRVHYDTKQTNPKNTATGFYEDRTAQHLWCYDYINLTTIKATNDYDFSTILGPNMSYGIVADHLYQGNDLQTNFAVNHYSAHGHYVSPDLSGNSSGVIVIGEYNVVDGMAANGVGAISYDDVWGRLPIGQVLGNTLIVYADDDTGYNAPEGNVTNIDNKPVIVVHADGDDLSASMVQPGINYGISMSNALMRHPDTFTPPVTSTTSATLDTTGFADGTTIYIDGDLYADILKVSGGLTIKKRENQTIVFNFDTTKDLEISQLKVYYWQADGTFKRFAGEEDTTTTDTTNGTDKNNAMDILSRHLVWNLNGVKGKTTIREAGGIFLQPNRNSEIDIQATSGGWIVSNGFVYNSSAEWHNFYIDMPDTNKLNLRAVKTVDGKIPRDGQKFEFFLDEYDPNVQGSWRQIDTKQNTNANVVFDQMKNLSEGWHVFRIHENTTVPTGDGIEAGLYIIDQTTYYAVAHVTKTTDVSGDRYIITPPTYYKGLDPDGHFDSSKFSAENGPQDGAFGEKVTAATFDNEAVKQGLTIEKKVEGTTDTTRKFTFEIELKDVYGAPLTGSLVYTVNNISGEKTLTLANGKGTIVLRNGQKATIEGLDVGTQYTIREIMVDDTVITSANKDNVDGYDVPDEPVYGTIQGDISITRFTNVYHASGSETVRARKTLNNHQLLENQFKFTLTPLNSADSTVREAYNDANGNVTFTPDLKFDETDMTGALVLPNGTRIKVLMYYVSESDGTRTDFNYGNVTYDGTKILVITLTDDGKGHITAQSVPGDFTVSFVNNYELKAPGTLGGWKKMTGRDMTAGEFTFTARLYQFTDDSITETYDVRETIEESTGKTDNKGNQIMKTVSNPAYQTSAHGVSTKLTAKNTAAAEGVSSGFTFPTVYYMDSGAYYYQITENTGLGELPMGINAVDPSKTYYAKVTVPPLAGRTENTVSTVEYFSDAACSISIDQTAVLFENEQPTIDFTVTKSWTDQNGAAKNEGYSIVFAVKQNGRDYPVTDGHLEITSGDAAQVEILTDGTVRLTGNANGWPVVKLKKLPVATYTVTETVKTPAAGDTDTYTTTYEVGGRTAYDHATVTENESSVTIHNSIGDDRYTSITVEKKWKTGETEYTPDSGSVTFRLTRTETSQVPVTGGNQIYLKVNNSNESVTQITAGNKIIVSYEVTFNNANDKKTFYEQYNSHKINVQYANSCDGTNFNGNATNGNNDNEVHPSTPENISKEDRDRIADADPITVIFEIPTSGKISGTNVTIDSVNLKGVHIKDAQIGGNGTKQYKAHTVEPGYNTETSTTTSQFTVDAEHGWRTVLNGLPLSKSNPVTSYTYTVEEISVNGTAVAESPFTVTYNNHEDIIGGTVTVTNTKQETDLTVSVTKKWYSLQSGGVDEASWPAGVSSVKVKIQKKNADGTVANLTTPEFYTNVSDTWSDTLELTSASQTQTWHHLDELQDGEAYVVTETFVVYNGTEIPVTDGIVTVNGVTYDVSCGPVSSGSATVVNAGRTNMNVTKTWDVPEGDTISFEKPENAEVGSSYLSGSTVTVPKSALMIGVRLHRRMYQGGTEVSGSDFDLTNADEAKYGETKLLYSAANASAAGRYANIFTDGANWSGEWQNLPTARIDASGVVTTYAYSVEEVLVTVPAEYMHDGSNGLVNIADQFHVTTNTSTAGTTAITNKLGSSYHLDVIKVWKDSSDNIVNGDPIEFKLLQNKSGSTGGTGVNVHVEAGFYKSSGFYGKDFSNVSRVNITVITAGTIGVKTWGENSNYDTGSTEVSVPERTEYDEVISPYNNTQTIKRYKYEVSVTAASDKPNIGICIADNDICDGTGKRINEITVTPVYASTPGTAIKPNPSGAGYVADETATFTLNPANNWTMQFRDLPMTGVEDGNTVNYTYSVQEVSPSGTDSHGNAFTTTYSGNPYDPAPETAGGDPRNGTITITNNYSEVTVNPAELNILKLKENNSGNEPAEGIQFTLKDSSDNTVTSGTTAADGKLTLEIPRNMLGAMTGTKTFTLYEDNPPENYASDSPWTVMVTGTLSGTVYNWAVTSVTTESGNVSLNQDNDLYYTILNRRTQGSVAVEKIFSGVTALPENFGITASWTPAEGTTVTVNLKATAGTEYTLPEGVTSLPEGVTIGRTGNGADGSPYRWTISGLPVGTVVTFAEHDYQVNGYIVSAVATNNGRATAAVTPGEVTITNIYTPGVELPSTGGSGTALYTVLGLMLTLLAGSLLILRKRTAKGHR